MKPLNTTDRSSAFLYFLILFIITTALVVVAVFFGMQVPFKERDKLKQQLSIFQSQRAFVENFGVAMTDAQILLDSITKPGAQSAFLNKKISENLGSLSLMIDKDTSGIKKIYQDILHNLQDLQSAKMQLLEASNKNITAEQYLQEIADLKEELRGKTEEANNLRAELISLTH